MKRISNALDRWFPERQLMLRSNGRVSFINLSRTFQVSLVCMLMAAAGWSVFASVSYVFYGNFLRSKDTQVADARLAYKSLLSQMVAYQQKFSSITGDLESNHSMMLDLVSKNTALQQTLKTVSSRLYSTEQERETVLAARQSLREQLADNEDRLMELQGRNTVLKSELNTVEGDLQSALSERNDALFKSNSMRRQIKDLEDRLVNLENSEQTAVRHLTERTVELNQSMNRVVEITGLDPKRVLSHESVPKGQGGPFIAATPDGKAASKLKASLSDLDQHLQHSETLKDLMRRLPLTPPLTSYRVTSPYGKRRDPINKKWAAHYGLDMGAPFKSSVYVAAPGVVKAAGWKGKYGKFVEVDHGAGVVTRFGHLHKILVKRGQKLNFRDKIGLLGSTGRSTGAHLHYEVVYRGKNMNPLKFFKAGRYVFQE